MADFSSEDDVHLALYASTPETDTRLTCPAERGFSLLLVGQHWGVREKPRFHERDIGPVCGAVQTSMRGV